MRMWCVDVTKMCRKHLLGEHVECHMFVGTINKGISIQGYLDDGLVEVDLLWARHDELAKEIERRGYNHKSPLPEYKWGGGDNGCVDVSANEVELRRRCKDCTF